MREQHDDQPDESPATGSSQKPAGSPAEGCAAATRRHRKRSHSRQPGQAFTGLVPAEQQPGQHQVPAGQPPAGQSDDGKRAARDGRSGTHNQLKQSRCLAADGPGQPAEWWDEPAEQQTDEPG